MPGGIGPEINKAAEIRNELEIMKKLHEQMLSGLAELEQRIGIVLRQGTPTDCVRPKAADVTAPLAIELREENRKITELIGAVIDIKNRVEL